MGKFIFDKTDNHEYFNDFDRYVAAEWTITTTEAGAGDATEALANVDGGCLLLTNDAADNDCDFLQKIGESFKFEVGKRLYFEARFKVSDATQSDFIMGLQITDTSPLAVTDGIFFQKDDGDANLDFHVVKDSTATDSTAIATVANDTFMTVAFYYDGTGSKFDVLVNDVVVAQPVLTNVPDDEELTISFGIQNGEAVAKTMTIDYVFVSKAR